jgi:hypothetical protein
VYTFDRATPTMIRVLATAPTRIRQIQNVRVSPFIQVHITAATERLTRDCKSVRNRKNGAAQSKCGQQTPSTMIWSGSKWVQCRLSCASGSTRVASQPHIIASVAPTHLPTVPRVRMHTAIMTCRHDVSFSPSPFTMKAIVPAWVRRGGGGIRRHSRSTWSSLQRDTRPELSLRCKCAAETHLPPRAHLP